MRDNKDTEYGRGLCFADISSEEDYRRRVPVTRYEDYNGLCARNRYTVYPVRYTLASSGSTGKRKVFPLTEEALDRYGDYIYSMEFQTNALKRYSGTIPLIFPSLWSALMKKSAKQAKGCAHFARKAVLPKGRPW